MSFYIDAEDDNINELNGAALANLQNPFVLNVALNFANILTTAQLEKLNKSFLEVFYIYISEDATLDAQAKVPNGGTELVHAMINMKHLVRSINKIHKVLKAVSHNIEQRNEQKNPYLTNNTNKDEPNKDEPNKDEPNKDEPNKDEPNKDEPNKDEPNKDEPNKDEPIRDEPIKEKANKDKANKEKANKDRANKDRANRDDDDSDDFNNDVFVDMFSVKRPRNDIY
jgi:hypothetical protein